MSPSGPRFPRRILPFAGVVGVVGAAVLALFASTASSARAAEPTRLTVLFTSDLHAHLMPYDALRDKPADFGLARVVTRVRAIRREAKNVLLLDGGDTIQGSPIGFLHARPPKDVAVPAGPDPTITAMNAAGYDAMTVGNHEFNYGLDVLRKAEGDARFPWLSANIRKDDGSPAFREYLVRKIAGVRVGILGLTTPGIPRWEPEANRPGLRFEDPVAVAKRLVPELRGRERCDVVVVTFHSGLEVDPATGAPNGTDYENRVAALAREVPGIDLLLTGHTHRRIPLTRVSGVPVFQPGRWGEVLVRADVTVVREEGRARVAEVKGELLPSDASVPPDPAVAKIAEPWVRAEKAYLDATVATATAPFPAARARLGDSPLLDLVHEVQLRVTGADLSLASLLPGASYEGLPAGPIRVRDAYALYPYENQLVVVEIDGAILKDVLERAAEYYRTARWDGGRLALAADPDMASYDFDTVEGASYRIDPTAPPGARVKGLSVHGLPVRPDERFTLAVNSYRAQGGGGYAALRRGRVLKTVGDEIRDLLIARLRERGQLQPVMDENWVVAPDAVWEGRDPKAP